MPKDIGGICPVGGGPLNWPFTNPYFTFTTALSHGNVSLTIVIAIEHKPWEGRG